MLITRFIAWCKNVVLLFWFIYIFFVCIICVSIVIHVYYLIVYQRTLIVNDWIVLRGIESNKQTSSYSFPACKLCWIQRKSLYVDVFKAFLCLVIRSIAYYYFKCFKFQPFIHYFQPTTYPLYLVGQIKHLSITFN